MRKTSQDGGDSTSITSGIENELKKSNVGIIKTKRNSIKRKVQNFSHESDDTVIEPLLQIDKKETMNRSAKYLLSKSKTESLNANDNNMYSDTKCEKPSVCKSICATGTITTNSSISRTLHNHMNTNVFGAQSTPTVKSPVLVEINGCRPVIHSNLTSSIFTTAKIHADCVTKHMEPIQVTPVPILSTVEGNVVKASVSPEDGQNKSIASNMNSDVLKSGYQSHKVQIPNTDQIARTSHAAQVGDSKSDLFRLSTGDVLNKLGAIDSRSITKPIIKTEIQTKVANEPSNITMAKVTASSTVKSSEIEKVTKISPTAQLSANKFLDKKTVQEEQRNESLKNTLHTDPKESQIKTAVKAVSGESLQKQNMSNMKTTVPVHDASKTTDKIISSTSNVGKQLQRQKKTVIEDPRDSDIHLKVTDEESVKADNESIKSSKEETSTLTSTATTQSISDTVIPTNKSKDQLIHSTGSQNSSKVKGKAIGISSSQVKKSLTAALPHTAVTANQTVSLPITQATSMTASLASGGNLEKKGTESLSQSSKPKETTLRSTVTLPALATVSVRPESTLEKKLSVSSGQSSKSIISDSSFSTAMTKEFTLKQNVQVQPTQLTSSHGLESEKKSTPSLNQSSKPVREQSSKEITSKSIVTNLTQNQKSVPASKASTPVTVVADVRTSVASEQHKPLKPQIATTGTTITTNIKSSDTISVTKTEAIPKSPVVVSSSAKLPVAVPKKPTKTSSVKSTATTTTILTPTTAKSTTVAKPSTSTSKPNLIEKHGKK